MLSPTDISASFEVIRDALESGSKDYKLNLKWLFETSILFQTLGVLKKNGEYSLIGNTLLALHDSLRRLPVDFSALTDDKDKIKDLLSGIAMSLKEFGDAFAEGSPENKYKFLEELALKTTEVHYWADRLSAALPSIPME